MSAKAKKKAVPASLTPESGQNAPSAKPDPKKTGLEGGSNPGKPRKKPIRRVWGRVKTDVQEQAYTFEMRKPVVGKPSGDCITDRVQQNSGGVFVRKKNSRTVEQVAFDALAAGGGRGFVVAGTEYRAKTTEVGVEVRRKGFKKWKLVSWETLANCAKEQMTLFPE